MSWIFRQVHTTALNFPSRTALLDPTGSLTYGELAVRAEAVGRHLVERGVGPGHRVGVLLERGVDLPAALLGVSAAGGAYVPLDPSYPRERLQAIVQDADLSALITDSNNHPKFAGHLVRMPFLAAVSSSLAEVELPRPRPQDPAYVIHTSGSTGSPKGVVVTNANVRAFFEALDVAYGVPVEDCFLALTSVSFDIALMELIWPLTRGGSVAIAPRGIVNRLGAGGDSLPALVTRFRPTLMQSTPSLLSAFTAYPESLRSLRMLRALAVGGEAFPPGLARTLLDALPGVRIVNMYGPTEATVWCSSHDITPEDVRRESIPIGRPLQHAAFRVVDESGVDIEPGDIGELWVGGPCVADGYFRRPGLTREKFVVLAAPERQRWYRTGDRARAGRGGAVELIGRLDRQVKVSGVRVELDEVESVLSTSPDVRAAAVVACRGPDGRSALVAYVERR